MWVETTRDHPTKVFPCHNVILGDVPDVGPPNNLYWYFVGKYRCSKPIFRLTHWGRVTHICVGNLTIIGSDNGSSPRRRQAIIWTNAGILLIGPLGTNFSEILIATETFSFKKMHLKISSAKWRPFCLGLNVLTPIYVPSYIHSNSLDQWTNDIRCK